MKSKDWSAPVAASLFIGLFFAGAGICAAQQGEGQGEPLLKTGTWTSGGGIGMLAETPDETAFAVNGYADRFLSEEISVGPLLQLGFTDDLAQYGFSGQFKYWKGLPDMASPTKLVLQAGVGVVHAAFRQDDTSWLVPLGVGIDHTMDALSLYAMFLLNLTDLDTGGGTEADLMPGVTFGVRF